VEAPEIYITIGKTGIIDHLQKPHPLVIVTIVAMTGRGILVRGILVSDLFWSNTSAISPRSRQGAYSMQRRYIFKI